MTDICVLQRHNLSHKKAKAAAQKVADKMAEEYDIESEWNGDILCFQRIGVAGTLEVFDTEARLKITLGLLLSSFAPMIEAHVAENMNRVFRDKE